MKKSGLWIVLTLVFTGIILGTLGTWSVPLGHGVSAFWPAFVVQVAGSAWFGGWGVLAAVIFPILTNALAGVGWSGILGYIPANIAQGLIPAWAFRYFRIDPSIPGRKGLIFYSIWGALVPAVAGGALGSVAVILFGGASWIDYPLLVVKWAAPNLVVSFLIGIPILRELTPLWRDLGLLVKNWWLTDRPEGWLASPRHFRDMPIHLKLALAMGGTGLGPLLILSLLELAQNGGNSASGTMTPLFLSISLVVLVLAVGFLSRETVHPLEELKEQVEALMQDRNGVLAVERMDEIGQLGQAFAFLLDDRRRAEASLQASEEKYRTLVENLNVGIFQSTLDGTFLHANSAVIHLAGYDNWEEFKQLPASSLYVDLADRERLIAELMAQGRVWNIEMRSTKKDGTIFWISISAVLLKDDKGKPNSILGSVLDITERKQAEEKLAASEAELRALFAAMTDIVIVYDANGRYLKIAPTNPSLLYRPLTDLLGKSVHDVLPTKQADYIMAKIGEAIQTGQVVTGEYALPIDGKEVWFSSSASRLSDNTVIWMSHDITKRRQAEDALRESEARFRTLYDNATIGLYRTTPDGRILMLNPAGVRMLGYDSFEEIAQRDLEDPKYQVDYPRSDFREKLEREGTVFGLERRMSKKDGSAIFVRESAKVTRNEKGEVLYYDGSFEDITERKQADDEIRRLNNELEARVIERTAQLEEANKELESFSYSVSHDLRAPLRAMDGYAHILQEEYLENLPPDGAKLLDTLRASAKQMGLLIEGLLKLSKLGRHVLNTQTIQPALLVQHALETLRREQDARQVEVIIGELPACEGDPTLLLQVWVNLLSNALKYTLKCDVARIEVGCQIDENGEKIYFVKDNGVGFDMRFADKLFGVFQRLHSESEFEGTGVGLALVRRIIQRHGGRIWADSQPGVGTVFYFSLP